jgi:hypothetical protein
MQHRWPKLMINVAMPLHPWSLPRTMVAIGLLGAAFLALAMTTDLDPDVFHEMALARAAVQRGAIPKDDLFAYTPTLHPVIHHEWATGFVFYFLTTATGAAGLLTLHYALGAVVLGGITALTRRRGAPWPIVVALLMLAAPLLARGFNTVRAQFLSLALTVILLWFLELDRAGRRWWLWVWLVLHVFWLNCHAGFVVGLGVLGCHLTEEFLRTHQIIWRLAALLTILAALTLLNPYGPAYAEYIWHAVVMPRPLIGEWWPLWQYPSLLPSFGLTLVLTAYAWWRLGWRRLDGVLIVAIAACLALRHARHAPLYMVIWTIYAAGWLAPTPLAKLLDHLWLRRSAAIAGVFLLLGVTEGIRALHYRPWEIHMPMTPGAKGSQIAYPIGPAEFLRARNFRGNVLAPYAVSAYLSWTLEGRVKVAIDGRYEVAYPLETADQLICFFHAQTGWQTVLTRYPTDLVLVPRGQRIATAMAQQTAWCVVYQDDAWVIHARPGLDLPAQDRRGQTIVGHFP